MENLSSNNKKSITGQQKSEFSNPYVMNVPKISKTPETNQSRVEHLPQPAVETQPGSAKKVSADELVQNLERDLQLVNNKSSEQDQRENGEKKEPRREDLIDIPLQLNKPVEQTTNKPETQSQTNQAEPNTNTDDVDVVTGQKQRGSNSNDVEAQDDGTGQYQFLKFHMVEDDNATDESGNNRSGDEGVI